VSAAPARLDTVLARRVLQRDLGGSSSPVRVDADGGPWQVKLRGAAQGTAALVAEVVVAGLAEALGLPVPERRVVVFPPGLPSDDRNDELADLLRASEGENLGFRLLPGARPLRPDDIAGVPLEFATRVRWLDWLVSNMDRGPANPNILVDGGHLWLIDHGASLPFQHDWRSVTEDSPRRSPPAPPHVFDGLALDLAARDAELTGALDRETLARAVACVPDSFLAPLVTGSTPEAVERRRAAYAAFLWKRLRGPRPFAAGAPAGRP